MLRRAVSPWAKSGQVFGLIDSRQHSFLSDCFFTCDSSFLAAVK